MHSRDSLSFAVYMIIICIIQKYKHYWMQNLTIDLYVKIVRHFLEAYYDLSQ